MSQRGKRGNHLHHPRLDVEPQPPPNKRRKGRPPNGGGGGLGGGLGGGGGGSGGGPGYNPPFATTSQLNAVNCVRTLISSNSTPADPDLNPYVSVCADEAVSSTSAKAVCVQGSSSSAATWQPRSVSDIKMSSIYNRSATEAPAELYRKDLISAMKLPDSEQLANYEYLVVNDQWKQEWERGVQVPVNPDSLPEPYVEVLTEPIVPPAHDFKLPKNRFLRITKDDTYSPDLHCLTNVVALAENTCAYDIDQVDEAWLKLYNCDRFHYGAFAISETQFERVIEELEVRCWDQIQVILKNEEGLGIEYDENVICDVCRSPDSEEANEMVFCDNCNICVHQACYGITAIPSGQWLCRTCSMGIKPDCVLCPNKGGAMKSTKSGKHWAHVSCALWIPEVSIGCVDRMEPITKISSIPASRWALLCVLCRGRDGACIQCSIKTCKTAYHVTCAFQHGLEMRAIIEEGNAEDGVKLRSYCHKHSVSKGKKEANNKGAGNTSCKSRFGVGNNGSGTEDDDCRRRKSRKSDMTSEERNQVRARRLQEVESEFDKHVNIKDISCHLFDVDDEAIEAIYNYWKLKRKSRHNRALIPPKSEDVEMIARKQEQQDLENHKLVVHLRQDLERVRNLCYMVSRREKLSRSLFKLREQVFYKQISVLSDTSLDNSEQIEACDEQFKNAVIYANDGPTLYDRFYSSCDKNTQTQYQSLEYILNKLLGNTKLGPKSATKASRASTSPTKRASKTGVTNSAGKSIANKKVNNGAITTAKTIASTEQVIEKQLQSKTSSANRRSSVGADKSSKNTAVATTASTLTTPSTRPRTSTSRTPTKPTKLVKATKNVPKRSDYSSSSSGSSSSEDEDSSSTSASGSSSGSESGSSSTDSASSSSKSKVQSQTNRKSSPKQIAQLKKETYSRSIEMRAKQRRRSNTQFKTDLEVKTSLSNTATSSKDTSKFDVATVISSSSDIEMEADRKKPKVSVPVRKSGPTTSEPNGSKTSESATSLLLSQLDTAKDVQMKDSSSSDDSIELLPLKSKQQSTVEGGKDASTCQRRSLSGVNRKMIDQIYSDSESSSYSDNKEKEEDRAAESNVSDSQNQQTIRTKAAMKEFTLQQQTCSKSKKDVSTTSFIATGKSEKSKENQLDSNKKVPNALSNMKQHKLSSDLMVVPQRKAAKKASENMRSTNSNLLAGIAPSLSSNNSNLGTLQRELDVKLRDLAAKPKDNLKPDEKLDKTRSGAKVNEPQFEKPCVNKRGRPPKNVKDLTDTSQSSAATTSLLSTTPSRPKEQPSSVELEANKLSAITTEPLSEDKSSQNRSSEAATKGSSNDVGALNNILVAYVVPQRQAAKKAAEQLKNSNKPQQPNSETPAVAVVADEKERVNTLEKETKVKTPEGGRNVKLAPTRRMSMRDTSNSSQKEKPVGPTPTTPINKTPTTSRRRSKEETPVVPGVTATTPKRGTQTVDKKRKVSTTSSSESDSSSSSSTSDGSDDDSSSNSGSSYSSSSSEEGASDIADKEDNNKISTADAAKRNIRKSIDSKTVVAPAVASTSVKATKLSPQKQLKRNVSNASSTSTINSDESTLNKSTIQTRRKSAFLEEQALKSQEIKSEKQSEEKLKSIQRSPSPSQSKNEIPSPVLVNNKSLIEKEESLKQTEKEDSYKNTDVTIDSSIGTMKVNAETAKLSPSPQQSSTEVESLLDIVDKAYTAERTKETVDEKRQETIKAYTQECDKLEISEQTADDKNISTAATETLSSRDECSVVPMDIDEELTTVAINSNLPLRERSPVKPDELLVDIDPPAAPIPASPVPSSCSSGEDEDEQSNESNDNHEYRSRKIRGRRRRTRPGSPPMSAEEEHTHHTQHLLNEMELVRALEEERKNELAAANAESMKFTTSDSPGVAVIATETLEIIDLDSNSNSDQALSTQKQPHDTPISTPLTSASPKPSENLSIPSNEIQQSSSSSLNQEKEVQFPVEVTPESPTKISCPITSLASINVPTSSVEMGHHPIVDTILDLEDNANKKQQEKQQQQQQQQLHNYPNVLLNTSPFDSHSVEQVLVQQSESLNNLMSNDNNIGKDMCEEDSFQATRNLLEKLRKTKRNRTDEPKEPDLMLPPPTPAIPSVFPFHNAADPDDIIHVQKENDMSSMEANSAGHYSADNSQPTHTTTNNNNNNNSLVLSPSPISATVPAKNNNITIYGNMSHSATDVTTTPTDTLSLSTNVINYIEGNGHTIQQNSQPLQLPISPMQQHSAQHTPTPHHPHPGTTPTSNYSQQPNTPTQQTPNVAELTSLIQKELASQTTPSLNKTSAVDNFGQKHNNNNMSSSLSSARVAGTTPDFVDLHAAATASKEFSASGSVDSNKLVVDCDFDENTRMQSPYTMQANRIWNENDLIAARRSTSPSSVSESNDQTPSIDLQQQPTSVQHQVPVQGPSHVQQQQQQQQQQHSIAPGVLNNSNDITKPPTFFSSINNFGLSSSFQQHPIQTQTQQQSPLVNGIDSIMYNQGYSSTPSTPTTQATTQQQQTSTQQFNGSVNLFHDTTATLSNINQIPFVPNSGVAGNAAGVMYPTGSGIGSNNNSGTCAQQSRTDMYSTSTAIGSSNTSTGQYSGAAFTSSTHNIALTAAIVGVSGPGSLIDHNSPHHHQIQQPSHQFNLTSPNNANTGSAFNNIHMGNCAEALTPTQQQQSSHHSTPTKDSPSKTNRTSARYSQQTQQQQQLRNSHKSPQIAQHKSPGKSPRQMELLSKQIQQQQQQAHASLTEYTSLSTKTTKYDPLTHTLAGKPRQRAPRGSGTGARSRGRGRGRGRGSNVANAIIPLPLPMSEYVSADNLVGTPFEFSYEEEMGTPRMENLQSLRDRRRSFDCRNAHNSDAQKYRSPSYNTGACKVRNSATTTASSGSSATGTQSLVNCTNTLKNSTSNLHSIVQPMLPGPVDMRTYNLGFEHQHSSASQEAYNNNLLGAFDSGTADQTLTEFDEDDEREFQSALRATGTSNSLTAKKQLPSATTTTTSLVSVSTTDPTEGSTTTNILPTYTDALAPVVDIPSAPINNIGINTVSAISTPTTHTFTTTTTSVVCSAELVTDLQTSMETTSEDVSIDSDTTLTTKASLSDSRNQLKLKIKGPLAYPDNYNSSSTIAQTAAVVQTNTGNVQSIISTNTTVSASVSGGGTNSRRMRKKELLSLYVVQKDNHGDDSFCGLPATDSSLLSSLMEVTRKTESVGSEVDDYSSEFARTSGSKRFKKNSSRELRSLDVITADVNELSTASVVQGVDGRRRSACSSGSTENSNAKTGAACSAGKRRGRSKTLEGADEEPTPKLKIKIRCLNEGNASATATMGTCETSFNSYEVSRRSVACPPKKRLTTNYTPTLEDLKRDSMNYRDQVMQEFGGDDEERTKRSSVSCNSATSKSLVDQQALPPTKKAKSSKSKKDKKEKKRHRNRQYEESLGGMTGGNNMMTTLVAQSASASPGEPPKLILRIKQRKAESTATDTSVSSPATAVGALPPEEPPSAPIRLKLARVSDGGGYVIGDKKRKKHKKVNSPPHPEDLATNTNSNASCSVAAVAPVSIIDLEKFTEDANARTGMASSPAVTYTNYSGVGINTDRSTMIRAGSEAAKDSSTPSPCLVIDSSKSNDLHDSSNTASSLQDPSALCIPESIQSPATAPKEPTTMAPSNSNENSNSQSSALSSHSRLSNSNSMISGVHQSQNSTATSNSNPNNHSNNSNTNSSSNNNNNNSNSGGSGHLLTLQKNCEVR